MEKRKPRRLELNRETVRELSAEELTDAAGGRIYLPTQLCTGFYPSINAPCFTLSLGVCA